MTYQPDVLLAIHEERRRQVQKWGVQNHPISYWFLILGEEVGEAQREACEHVFRYMFPKQYPDDPERLQRLRAELIQVGAVVVAMVESLDRNELKAIGVAGGGGIEVADRPPALTLDEPG